MSFAIQLPGEIAAGKILSQLNGKPARILDVGCGDGALLEILDQAGCFCLGIEKSKEGAREARKKGLEIRIATWPDFKSESFDIIIFSRVLHHFSPLEPCISKAYELLKTGGFLFVDDFAFAMADQKTAAWFYDNLKKLENAGLIDSDKDEFVGEVLESDGGLSPWKNEDYSELNSAETMENGLRKIFDPIETRQVPYLYRYITRTLPENAVGLKIAKEFLAKESKAAETNKTLLIGRQFLAKKQK